MIIYFSGTGNSEYAARKLAQLCSDRAVSIPLLAESFTFKLDIKEGEPLGIVFPIYAWGPPKIVTDYLSVMEVEYRGYSLYTYALATCGDETGRTMERVRKLLGKRGIELCGEYSVRMPNNYIIGFDVDPDELANEKLEKAEARLGQIAQSVKNREEGAEDELVGSLSRIKSTLVNRLFNRFMIGDKKFAADDSCTKCGLCEKTCPVRNITVDDTGVQWHGNCCGCLGCINTCPQRAIQYGKSTVKKGRYYNEKARLLRQEDEAKKRNQ